MIGGVGRAFQGYYRLNRILEIYCIFLVAFPAPVSGLICINNAGEDVSMPYRLVGSTGSSATSQSLNLGES